MNDVTRILNAIEAGAPQAADELLPLVYNELRQLAAARLSHESPGQTLQATALVHESFVRLVGNHAQQPWNSRGHFFAAAAEAMRRILVEQARRKLASIRRPDCRLTISAMAASTAVRRAKVLCCSRFRSRRLGS